MKLIPDELRRAHEDGEVVFFCGAGVSQAAGLPGFRDLVCKVMTHLLPARDKCAEGEPAGLAWAAFDRCAYDDALDLLESPNLGTFDAEEVRRRVRKYLSPPTTGAADAHAALIRLADLDRGQGRLVTTNFDRLFETAYASIRSKSSGATLELHVAPALPPASPSAFRGLLYLHGRLDPHRIERDRSLVLTRSDFGMAYLLDGWARRFVVDLFRNYHVVFLGYSVDDPTVHYLVSAMAAVREANPRLFRPAYSFAGYRGAVSPDERDRTALTWKSKGVKPVLYDSDARHVQLWDGIRAWADYHGRGLAGHRQTVRDLGPVTLTGKKDDRIAEMAWALKKPGIAEYFAKRVGPDRPVPAWIAPLQERELLSRPEYRPDDPHSPRAPLVSRQLADFVTPDDTTAYLSRWIAQCLENRHTLYWALAHGGVLHSVLRRDIRWALDDVRSDLPLALRKIWRVLARDDYAGALSRTNSTTRSSLSPCNGLSAKEHFARNTLLRWLRPVPVFQVREPGSLGTTAEYESDPSQWYALDLALEGIDHRSEITEIKQSAADWNGTLAVMAEELTGLLNEAMDWLREFGLATDEFDLTYIHYRSISPHEQNAVTPLWTELIGLCRDAHDALIASTDGAQANGLRAHWRSLPYPVFRRLALHAATEHETGQDVGLEMLITDRNPTLWDPCVQRETLRFLRRRGRDLQEGQLNMLVREILSGPPNVPYPDGFTKENQNRQRGHATRLRLQKLMESGAHLSQEALAVYQDLPKDGVMRPRSGGNHPEEFNTFIAFGWGGVPGFEDPITVSQLRNCSLSDFIQWAEKHEHEPWILRTAWTELAEQDAPMASRRLAEAGGKGVWPIRLWSELVHALRDAGKSAEHRTVARVSARALLQMPVPTLEGMIVEASRWLKGNRELLEARERLQLWQRIWQASVSAEGSEAERAANLELALNHAGGHLGEFLYAEMADDIPTVPGKEAPGLPDRLKTEFALVSDGEDLTSRLARVHMAIRLVELHRVDPLWTRDALLSHMDIKSGKRSFEPGLWDGYFAGRQCSEDLLVAFKGQLLAILSNLDLLPERTRAGAVRHFVHLAIWQDRGIGRDEAKEVAWRWDETSLGEAAWAIADILQAAGNRVDVLWTELVGPWIEQVWPRREQDKTPDVSAALCRIAMAVDTMFPAVVDQIEGLLVPELRDDTLSQLSDRPVAAKFPEATLRLLNGVFGDSEDEVSTEPARKLWKEALETQPSLRQRPEFERLRALLEPDPDSETE